MSEQAPEATEPQHDPTIPHYRIDGSIFYPYADVEVPETPDLEDLGLSGEPEVTAEVPAVFLSTE